MAFDWISDKLAELHKQGYQRQRATVDYEKDGIISIGGQHYLHFASNDYLGMRHDEGVQQTWVEGIAQYGAGSGASPLVTGYTTAHSALESYLAEHLNREAALLFNSGFAANQALLQALFAQPGNIVADKLMHASFIDGAMSSQAVFKRFAHNDPEHLKALLENVLPTNSLIATESVFSMDGDQAPLKKLAHIASEHGCWLMVDDAHGFGVLGEKGLGCAESADLSQCEVPVLMGTFGKAVGTAGAFIAGSRQLIELLINTARHYIYSTAMPPAQALATLYSLEQLRDGRRQKTLNDNIHYFKTRMHDSGFKTTESQTAIQPVLTDGPKQAVALSEALKQRGIWVPPIRYPTVPKGTDRLRVTLSAVHTRQDIDALSDALQLAKEAES
ncbi:8-amino-7-oxononanoate synthase [Salinimonas sp. HHU 13199]|uniref:8-amino-7-ketopelargonate synthase n=1 Tax=Salinimonas profundi TaxID=2729140 RepID=A0ABR8LFP9_9ALTE|nr:8-amino-7-oxononanoate synthase [Salinimonas profundi]MBD3585091.1 8-amino-7-oxononanoate synthase [Salinimonas profundi]